MDKILQSVKAILEIIKELLPPIVGFFLGKQSEVKKEIELEVKLEDLDLELKKEKNKQKVDAELKGLDNSSIIARAIAKGRDLLK